MFTEAIILAGGFGTRLQSIVNNVPKCMAPVNGKPFISYVVNHLLSQGVNRIIFSLGYKSESIIDYIEKEYKNLDKEYSIEQTPLGTGGAIKLACAKAKEKRVIIQNGDTLFKVNIRDLTNFHYSKNADCVVALKEMVNIDRYGTVDMNNKNIIIAFNQNHSCQFGLINGGVYILNAKEFLKENLPEAFSFETDYLQRFFSVRAMFGLKQDEYFIDIGVPDDYERARDELKGSE
jgi:D-glycero-alpha-D-manno-heptose 1-phosphate guanylyltransferase